MAEQKLYAVRLKDGTWFGGGLPNIYGSPAAAKASVRSYKGFTLHLPADERPYSGARVVPVRLVEDTDGR